MPSGIDIEDLTIGNGPTVERGQIVTIRWRGTLNRGDSFGEGEVSFKAGGRSVIWQHPSALARRDSTRQTPRTSGIVWQANRPKVYFRALVESKEQATDAEIINDSSTGVRNRGAWSFHVDSVRAGPHEATR